MKMLLPCTTTLAVLLLGLPLDAQETDEPNVEYEKLKVLEPYVGTWQARFTWEGAEYEQILEVSRSTSRKALITEIRTRLAGGEWEVTELHYHVWNHLKNQIEMHDLYLQQGTASVYKVAIKGSDVFAYSQISTSKRGETSDWTNTVSDESIRAVFTNRKDADGNPLDDFVFVCQRK